MPINRYELVSRHNPVLTEADAASPLSVGNGNFAYTADITGMQTLYETYKEVLPLCTMAQWGWHTKPAGPDRYAWRPDEVEMTEYPYRGRTVRYAVEKKEGNEQVYDWLRRNPHKFNLARIGLVYDKCPISPERITGIRQELKLYEGVLDSSFRLDGTECHVVTAVAGTRDAVGFEIRSELLGRGLAVELAFPYGSPDITASDWEHGEAHETEILDDGDDYVILRRTLDRDVYDVTVTLEGAEMRVVGKHRFLVVCTEGDGVMRLTAEFVRRSAMSPASDGGAAPAASGGSASGEDEDTASDVPPCLLYMEQVLAASRAYFQDFWEKGGVIDLHKSRDSRAMELERRIVLSQYLLGIQSAGCVPPAETGLTCNSWYGKAHLEMYFWHEAYLPLWNHTELLERSLDWYLEHLPEARQNAACNGYRGARWPKMVAADAVNSPSNIATLLVWQQPHIIYMLEMAYQNLVRRERESGAADESGVREAADMKPEGTKPGSREFLEKYYPLVEETAVFMADFAVYNEERGVYELLSPLIPVQENHRSMETKNPAFEVEYWRYTLLLAVEWAERLGRTAPDEWRQTAEHMAPIAVKDGCYLAHDNCPDSYGEYAYDHPSMLCAYGVIDSGRIDPQIMANSLRRVEEVWDYPSLWGWDFAVMCMTAVRLGEPEYAVRLLLMDTPKNTYVASGNNFQQGRTDLPLYLPGNGSLLLAAALMTAGYPGSGPLPGFPKDGQWEVEFEGIDPFPC